MNIALRGMPHRAEILPLTGLRAVAAIAVVVHHVGLPESAPGWLKMIAQCGFIGVPLFFMLSGFVLAYNYPSLQLRDTREVVRFWIARVARVMPLYWVVLIWAILMREIRDIPQDRSLPWHFFALQTWSGDQRVGAGIYNGPAWSICVEIFLYALFPFIVPVIALIARRWGTKGLLILAGAAFAAQAALWLLFVVKGWANLPAVDPSSAHRWLYRTPVTRLPEFLIGMTLAFLYARGARFTPRVSTGLQVAIAVLVPAICAVRDPSNGAVGAAFFGTLWTVPFALLIFALASSRGPLAWFLSLKGMLALGTASYALYITHRGLLPGLGQDHVTSAPGYWGYMVVVIVVLLTLVVAEGAHRYVELPSRRAIIKVANSVLGPRRVSTSPAAASSHEPVTVAAPQPVPVPAGQESVDESEREAHSAARP